MSVVDLFEDLENRFLGDFNLSRLKNQVVGKSNIAALKALVNIINIPKPTVFTAKDSSLRLCESIADFGLKNILLVTDQPLFDLGILNGMIETLEKRDVKVTVFSEVEPDPVFAVVEAGLKRYRRSNCDGVLAVGGGSSIDAAKVIALAASNGVEPKALSGMFKGKKPAAPFFVVPTTAGTGSEATIGAVISDTDTHKKELVIDPKTVPLVAALDPALMKGLPPRVTAATGIDALTHVIEGYLSSLASEESDFYARSGLQLIFKHLRTAYKRGTNLKARESMALASFYGGMSINMAGVGYCHAIAHQLGALYRIPHGEANAKVLPYILEFNKEPAQERMAQMARFIEVGVPSASDAELADAFIKAVTDLILELGIDPAVEGLKQRDIPEIIKAAFKEANSTYAVAKYMSYDEAESMLEAMAG